MWQNIEPIVVCVHACLCYVCKCMVCACVSRGLSKFLLDLVYDLITTLDWLKCSFTCTGRVCEDPFNNPTHWEQKTPCNLNYMQFLFRRGLQMSLFMSYKIHLCICNTHTHQYVNIVFRIFRIEKKNFHTFPSSRDISIRWSRLLANPRLVTIEKHVIDLPTPRAH